MPITERTLRKWRSEALREQREQLFITTRDVTLIDRILRMTQELLDQHLLRKG